MLSEVWVLIIIFIISGFIFSAVVKQFIPLRTATMGRRPKCVSKTIISKRKMTAFKEK